MEIKKIFPLIPILLLVFLAPCNSQNLEACIELIPGAKLLPGADSIHNDLIVPKAKRTNLGLYVTASEAYEMWKASTAEVHILDVRTLEEYIFVGHADMAYLAELVSLTPSADKEKELFSVVPNTDFPDVVNSWANKTDVILVMCRSGGRGALAVNFLHSEGFSKVYNIIDGMEGDKVSDPESIFKGKRMKNGWKNSGLPWTYELNKNQILLK